MPSMHDVPCRQFSGYLNAAKEKALVKAPPPHIYLFGVKNNNKQTNSRVTDEAMFLERCILEKTIKTK
jgi:hypothetical protein